MLFTLITFTYAARILMADGIGQVNFFSSIISYISLFTCLGIPMYAIRETARVRDNPKELSKTTTEILLLHACLSAKPHGRHISPCTFHGFTLTYPF